MWGRHKKLQKWVEAGLITQTQAITIEAYEDTRKKGKFGRGLVGLAIFSILCGVLSVIGANWHEISGDVKIGAHVLLNLGIGFAAFRAMKSNHTFWREGLALAFFGLGLTLIALIGQVLQLEGNTAHALLLWMLATLPFMLIFSQTLMTAIPWMLAFLTTVGFTAGEYLEDLPEVWIHLYMLGLAYLLPLALMGDGSLSFMKRWKPAWAEVCTKTGVVLLVLAASVSPLMFRFPEPILDNVEAIHNQLTLLYPFVIGALAIAVHAFFNNFYKNDPRMRAGALFAIVSLAVGALPYILLGYKSEVFGAFVFMGYWAFIGWLAQGLGLMRIVSLAIFIIAARVFVIYLEVFGSLMDMGIGFIVGGLVMLGLLWGARKLSARLTKKGAVQS